MCGIYTLQTYWVQSYRSWEFSQVLWKSNQGSSQMNQVSCHNVVFYMFLDLDYTLLEKGMYFVVLVRWSKFDAGLYDQYIS